MGVVTVHQSSRTATPLVIAPANAFISAPSTDFANTAFPLKLDPALITSTGQYAVIYSPRPLTNYVGTGTPTWVSTPGFSYSSITVTTQRIGTPISISGTVYFAVLVTIA